MTKQKIELGDLVKDQVTLFEGIVVCIMVWLQGCPRIGLQVRQVKEDLSIPDVQYFDLTQLDIIKKGAVNSENQSPVIHEEIEKKNGGPRPGPARR